MRRPPTTDRRLQKTTADRRPQTAVIPNSSNRSSAVGGHERSEPRRSRAALWPLLILFLLAGCVGVEAPLPPAPTPTATPNATETKRPTDQPTNRRNDETTQRRNRPLTATPVITTTLTPTPTARPSATPTPRVVILQTPAPPGTPAPEPTPAGRLIAYTEHLDFYAEPGSYWAQHVGEVAGLIEGDYRRIARRLRTRLPGRRVKISFQDPSTSPLVRGMNCPARGLYYGETESGPLLTIFADETTSPVQVLGVAAHELAHHLTFHKFGPGGDIILSEGLANWASPQRWSAWHGWPSFDAAVLAYRRSGRYMPLAQTLIFDPRQTQELGLGDCFALRDLRYNEWASFVGFLIDRYGLEVIARLWKTVPDRPTRPGQPVPTADYRRVLGKSLQELEREWLWQLEMLQEARLRMQNAER